MRRYAFYLAVALLTFGIGILAGALFVLKNLNKTETVGFEKMKKDEPSQNQSDEKKLKQIEPQVEVLTDNPSDEEICSGIDNDDYHEPAIKKWLKGQKIEEKPM